MADTVESGLVGERKTIYWLVPILFTFHNLEEIFFIRGSLNQFTDSVPNSLQNILPSITFLHFLVAVMVVTILPYLFVVLTNTERYRDWGVFLLIITQMVIFINVFSHFGMVILRQSYVPGVFTALAINLPFSLYFFYTILHKNEVRRKTLAIIFPLALLLHGPGLLGLMLLSGWITGLLPI